MRIRSIFCSIVLVLVVSSFYGPLAAELPEGFRLEPVVGGLTDPSAVAQTPDGRILVAERTTGNLRQVRHGELQAAPLCSVSVQTAGEAGLLGVAVHPGYGQTGWVYLYYTDLATGQNKVTRFTVKGDGCSGAIDVLSGIAAGAGFLRNGGGMGFGTDGYLYVATGDMEDGGAAQDTGFLQGKILRVDEAGGIPLTNPIGGSPVYASGIRDGRGLTIHPAGQCYVGDRGDALAHDEINMVTSGGDYGWDAETGSVPGNYDTPLAEWVPSIDLHGLAVYAKDLYPDLAADGLDNDNDAFGPDHMPGVGRTDDNGEGACVGSGNAGGFCTDSLTHCIPTRPGESAHYCSKQDDPAEYCPGGVPFGDDACGSSGPAGLDEPDESYLNNIFLSSDTKIERSVVVGAGLDAVDVTETFLDSTALADCPTGWTGLTAGGDGMLYALATNGGGAGTGALYRVVHDGGVAGPREVSQPGSPFALRVEKTGHPARFNVSWEDLRENSEQPRNQAAGVREYTVWTGDIGSYYSHAPAFGLGATEGIEVNDVMRYDEVSIGAGSSTYFLVSGRHDNLEGSLGSAALGERPGYAVTDLCDTIGYDASLYFCGPDFTLVDKFGESVTLYEEFRGRPVSIDMSAVWCPPCRSEADVLESMFQTWKDRDVMFLTVLMDEDDQAEDFHARPAAVECRVWGNRAGTVADHTFPCWIEPNWCPDDALGVCPPLPANPVWGEYNVGFSLPSNFILDQGMRVVWSGAGWGGTTQNAMINQFGILTGTTDSCLH